MTSCKILKIQIFLTVCIGFVFGFELALEEDSVIAFLNDTVSPDCSRDFQEILRGLKNGEEWALKIVDSMEKFPSGLLLGRRSAFGHFEECVGVDHSNFSSKHCILELSFKVKPTNLNTTLSKPTTTRMRYYQFAYGVCMPSTCSSKDLENSIEALGLHKYISTEMDELSCTTELYTELRPKDYFAIMVFSCIIIAVLAGTVYDVYAGDRKTAQSEVIRCFSLRTNLKSLFDTSETSQGIDSLHGIRFFSFTWLVLGHLYYGTSMSEIFVNSIEEADALAFKSHIPGSNGFLCVDTFFFLSGLLVCLVFFRSISGRGTYDFPAALIHRYLRLTPALAAILLFNSSLMSRLTVGPYSKKLSEHIEKKCHQHWWAYLLYIESPLRKGDNLCFPAVWYLCADMQLFLISPLVLYVLLRYPKFGLVYLSGLIMGGTLISFIVSYVEGVAPNPGFEFTWGSYSIYTYEYHLFLTRMTPWLVGIATGYIICGIKAKKIHFNLSRRWVLIGWSTAAFLCSSSLYGIALFYPMFSPGPHTSYWAYSSYRALHRLGWALGLSWVVLACMNNYGGAINTFLSHQAFKPLAKLTYCGFIDHISVNLFRYLNDLKTAEYYSTFDLIHTYLADIVMCLGVAIPMTLMIEMPFAGLEKILLKDLIIYPYPKSGKIEKLDDLFDMTSEKEKSDAIRNDKNGLG